MMETILEETAPLFGLRKTVKPDGSWFWRESKDKIETGWLEALYPSDIKMITSSLGFGSIILSLGNADYTTGSMQKDNGKCIWLLDGRRVDFEYGAGGFISSITNEADPNKPQSNFIDRRNADTTPKIGKCLHPECEKMVDRSKKKSGCCSKEHMNFECTNPACVERANINGWNKATHPFGSKIAQEHWQYRFIQSND